MYRYIKCSDVGSIEVYHASLTPIDGLSVENITDPDNLGVHFTKSYQDACAIASSRYKGGSTYIYKTNLSNLKVLQLPKDFDSWANVEVLRYLVSMSQYSEFSTRITSTPSRTKERAKSVRDIFKECGYNCLEYPNECEVGVLNNCLCVLDNSCIGSVELVDIVFVDDDGVIEG